MHTRTSPKYKNFSNIYPQSAAAECRRWSGIGSKACRLLVLYGSMGAWCGALPLLVTFGIGADAGARVVIYGSWSGSMGKW